MDFTLSEEHRLVQQMVRDFAHKEIAPIIKEWDRKQAMAPFILPRLAELGILGLCLPIRYGGQGMDYLSLGLACEELEAVDTSLRVILSVHVGLNSLADHVLWFARTNPEAANAHEGLSAFLIELNQPGVQRGDIHGKLGVRAGSTGWIALQDLHVLVENRIGEEGEGFKIAMTCLDNGRYTVAAGATGLIRACLEASVRYANQRQAFGREIGKFQLIQQKIAAMTQSYDAARLLYLRAGWMKNRGLRNTRETSLAKWFASDASFQAASDAVQIHGAYGYSDEYDVERYLRNSKGAVIYEGASEIHQLIQAGYALGYRQDSPLRCELPAYDLEFWQ